MYELQTLSGPEVLRRYGDLRSSAKPVDGRVMLTLEFPSYSWKDSGGLRALGPAQAQRVATLMQWLDSLAQPGSSGAAQWVAQCYEGPLGRFSFKAGRTVVLIARQLSVKLQVEQWTLVMSEPFSMRLRIALNEQAGQVA